MWGFVQAPFLHIHSEELNHDHGTGPTHVHVRGVHVESGPEIESLTADDDAIDVDWAISAPSLFHFVLPPENVGRVAVKPSVSIGAPAASVLFRSHDPPALNPENPRPPPA